MNRRNVQPRKKLNKGKGRVQGLPMAVEGPRRFRPLSLVFPPRMNSKLKFWTIQGFNLAVNFQANYRLRPTSAFDVDPALGGTSMAGFAELAGFYASYRVVSSRIKVTVSNPSAVTPVTLIVLPLNADPTNAFSAANVVASVGNPYAKTRVMGLLGSPPSVISHEMTTQKIFGDPAIYFDHNFSSLVTTSPANNWFWNTCLFTQANIATAFNVVMEVEVDCEFFDRIFLPA